MKQRLIALILAAACIVLGLIAFFLNVGQDRTVPDISVKKMSITYSEGDDFSSLLKGVTAKDNRDGDLTDQVFVDKIVPMENGEAVVYYGVMDKSKNIGTASRKIKYKADASRTSGKAGEPGDETGEPEESEEQEPEDPKSGAEEPQNTNDGQEELAPDGARPAIALNADNTAIAAGSAFDPMSVVRGVIDDKDDPDTLSRHVHVDGNYNVNVPGTYELRYYVSDSDGNTSDVKTFTLTVQ